MISYIGGKSKIGVWIRDYIPNNIETYVEPFGGMFWLFYKTDLKRFDKLKRVVYNDFNPLNVNLFKCVKNYEKFYEVIKDYKPQNKELFNQYQKEIFDDNFVIDLSEPNYEVACKYVYVLTQVWSGTNPKTSSFIDLKGKYDGGKFEVFKRKLQNPKYHKYFDKITVSENMDFEDVIKKYDSESTYFYCDPPYYRTEKYYANHEFGLDTHRRLCDTLKSIDGKFSLSYYHFNELDEWFDKERYIRTQKDFSKASKAKKGKTQTKGTELLIMNYNK